LIFLLSCHSFATLTPDLAPLVIFSDNVDWYNFNEASAEVVSYYRRSKKQ